VVNQEQQYEISRQQEPAQQLMPEVAMTQNKWQNDEINRRTAKNVNPQGQAV
jgi:hypothetical protein